MIKNLISMKIRIKLKKLLKKIKFEIIPDWSEM